MVLVASMSLNLEIARPLIGITVDNADGDGGRKYESNVAYSRTVAESGGVPLLLPQEIELAAHYATLCDGLLLTGGDDARSEAFGVPAHPEASCVDPGRQLFELALLDGLATRRPVLGVCFGMQLMALHAGGRLDQHLPDNFPDAVETHQHNHRHSVIFGVEKSALLATKECGEYRLREDLASESVVSSHHQAVVDAGRLRVVARAPDGVIEAIDDPALPFYVGVQWHPERGEGWFNFDLIRRFVEVCARHSQIFPDLSSSNRRRRV